VCVSLADFHPLVDSITYSDYYLLANDFAEYIATQVSECGVGVWVAGWLCAGACLNFSDSQLQHNTSHCISLLLAGLALILELSWAGRR
jgi:hypothetical protein